MLRMSAWITLSFMLVAGWVSPAWSATYTLLSGETISGEIIHSDAKGPIFKKLDGTPTPRIAWTNFTLISLKQLAEDPKAKSFVEPLLQLDEDIPEKQKAREDFQVQVPERLERPQFNAGLGALFRSPLSLALLLAIYAANLFAAFEIAIYRNYSWLLVCGAAAVAPVLAPIIFLCLPIRRADLPEETAAVEEAPPAEHAAAAPGSQYPLTEVPGPKSHPGYGTAPANPAAPSAPAPVVYQRGQTMFNRRFFETKLAGFLRVVPSESEKNMVLCVQSSRGNYIATRITRIMPNEIILQVPKEGAAFTDVTVPFSEIQEIQVRQKDT